MCHGMKTTGALVCFFSIKMFIKSELLRGDKVGLVSLIKLPIPGYEFYQFEIDLTDIHNIILDISIPTGWRGSSSGVER